MTVFSRITFITSRLCKREGLETMNSPLGGKKLYFLSIEIVRGFILRHQNLSSEG